MKELQRWREGDWDSNNWFICHVATAARPESGASSSSPVWVQGPSYLGHLPLLSWIAHGTAGSWLHPCGMLVPQAVASLTCYATALISYLETCICKSVECGWESNIVFCMLTLLASWNGSAWVRLEGPVILACLCSFSVLSHLRKNNKWGRDHPKSCPHQWGVPSIPTKLLFLVESPEDSGRMGLLPVSAQWGC